MTSKTLLRFKGFTQMYFYEIARARIDSQNGTTTGTGNSPELSDLINSYIERNEEEEDEKQMIMREKNDSDSESESESKSYWSLSETKKMLKDLFGCNDSGIHHKDNDDVKLMIRAEIELASQIIKPTSSLGFKPCLVNQLRERGFDAGLCKTHREKLTGFTARDYEYIDIIIDGTRYIIEVALDGEFTIARPSNRYLSLLAEFPQIFVGKPEELKEVVKLMCKAAKESLKSKGMHVPPWRRNRYMQTKWFGSNKRITNVDVTAAARNEQESLRGKGRVEAAPPAIYHYYCRIEVAGKGRLRVGNLAQALNGSN